MLDVASDADFSGPGHGRVRVDGVELEFAIPDDEPFTTVVIAFGAADRTVVNPIIRTILARLDRLGLRACDADAPGQIFI